MIDSGMRSNVWTIPEMVKEFVNTLNATDHTIEGDIRFLVRFGLATPLQTYGKKGGVHVWLFSEKEKDGIYKTLKDQYAARQRENVGRVDNDTLVVLPGTEQYLDAVQLAKIVKCHTSAIYNYAANGSIPRGEHVRGKARWPASQVEVIRAAVQEKYQPRGGGRTYEPNVVSPTDELVTLTRGLASLSKRVASLEKLVRQEYEQPRVEKVKRTLWDRVKGG